MAPRKLLTLDVFIQQQLAKGHNPQSNAFVTSHGFAQLYVRMGARWIGEVKLYPVLDIGSVTARYPGKGAFTSLVERLRAEYPELHIYVEQVLNERFGPRLEKLGFTKLSPAIHGESYFLKAVTQ